MVYLESSWMRIMTYQDLMKAQDHVTCLSTALYHLQQQGYLCDCTIETCQANINVHQVVLMASGSPYFRKQLFGLTRPAGLVKTVLLKDQDLFVVQAVVQFVYTGEMYLTPCNVERILDVCSLLGLEEAVKLCHMFRQKYSTNREVINEAENYTPSYQDISIGNANKSSDMNKKVKQRNIAFQRDILSDIGQDSTVDVEQILSAGDSKEDDVNYYDSFEEVKIDNVDDQSKTHCEDSKYPAPLFGPTSDVALEQNCKSEQNSTIKSRRTRLELTKNSNLKNVSILVKGGEDPKDLKVTSKRRTVRPNGDETRLLSNTINSDNLNICQSLTDDLTATCSHPARDTAINPMSCQSKCRSDEKKGSFVLNFCRFCTIRFKDREKYQEHRKRVHLFTCDVCGWSSNRGLNLASHKYNQHGIHHRPDKYPLHHCDQAGCDFKSIMKHNITIHKKIHSKERQFRCDLCTASFKHKSQFNCHRKTHDPSNLPFTCDVCRKAFPRNSLLKAHTKNVHHRDELCHLCPWKSSSRRELYIHLLRVHNIPLPNAFKIFQCGICDYYTFTRISYRSHMDLHNGRKYQCKVCGKFLETEMRLYVHERKHKSEVKMFSCSHPDCDYKTMSKATLKIHQDAKHSNYKPFQCHLCEFRCKVKGNLDKHLRGRHKMEVMTIKKLWDRVMATGQGYSSIVHRLSSFKSKGAIGMANDGDTEREKVKEETEYLKDISQAVSRASTEAYVDDKNI